MDKAKVYELAREYLRKNPNAMPAHVWSYVLEHGTPSVSESSFKTYHLYKIREELGLPRVVDPDRTAGARAANAARAREKTDAPPESKAAGAEKEPTATPEPDPEPAPEEPDPFFEPEPAASVPALRSAAEVGDSISLKLGGQRLEAQRDESGWTLSFEGSADDQIVTGLLGRLLTGAFG